MKKRKMKQKKQDLNKWIVKNYNFIFTSKKEVLVFLLRKGREVIIEKN